MCSSSQIMRGQLLVTVIDYTLKSVSTEKDWGEETDEHSYQLQSKTKITKQFKHPLLNCLTEPTVWYSQYNRYNS